MEHTLLYPLDTVKTCWQSQVLHQVSGKPGCNPCKIAPFMKDDRVTSNKISSVRPKSSFATSYSPTITSPTQSNSIWSTVKHLMKHSHSHHTAGYHAGVTTLASTRNLDRLAPNVVDMTNSLKQTSSQSKNTKRPWSKQSRTIRSATVADLSPNLAPSLRQPSAASGVQRLFRGIQSIFIGCIPAHALYFSSYEIIKTLSLEYNVTINDALHIHAMNANQAAIAGGVATFLHDSVMTPMDTIKQRMQLGHYGSLRDAFECIVSGELGENGKRSGGEGWKGLYRSFPITLVTNIPYGMIMMGTNEWLRGFLERALYKNDDHQKHHSEEHYEQPFHFLTVLLSGMGAGTVAAVLTAPLDRIKTRLQTQRMGMVLPQVGDGGIAIMEERALAAAMGEPKTCPKMAMQDVKRTLFPSSAVGAANVPSSMGGASSTNFHLKSPTPFTKTYYTTPLEAFQSILHEEGPKGLFRGTLPRVALHAPSVAISWTAYEMAKSWLVWSIEG